MSHLFEPYALRGVTLRNRIAISPMCQYSSVDGYMNDWHLVHLGSRAVGGAGLVLSEACAVTPEGRISPTDLGLWDDAHIEGHRRVTSFIVGQGAVAGIQLAHAGRKASRLPPWEGRAKMSDDEHVDSQDGAWTPVAPSPIPTHEAATVVPHEMTTDEIAEVVSAFAEAARRADAAGYDWIEIHAAHGYLLQSFCSPTSNKRQDSYGGSLENRIRIVRDVARAIRAVLPAEKVLGCRVSYTDWVEGGWMIDDTVSLAQALKEDGVDLIDVSSGGASGKQDIPVGAGYQVPGAEAVRSKAGIPVAAVGLITDPMQADALVRNGRADLVMLGREALRDPYWPAHAALALGQTANAQLPVQYTAAYMRTPGAEFRFNPDTAPRVIGEGGSPRIAAK